MYGFEKLYEFTQSEHDECLDMPGPPPKPPGTRQRRNRAASRAILPCETESARHEVPPLPPRAGAVYWPLQMRAETYLKRYLQGKHAEQARKVIAGLQWHPMIEKWWRDVWTSPMSAEYLEADKHGLYLLAELQQRRWEAESYKAIIEISKEIRQHEWRFGLSPIDRRRLQWEVEKGEQAAEKTRSRRTTQKTEGKDPRDLLKRLK